MVERLGKNDEDSGEGQSKLTVREGGNSVHVFKMDKLKFCQSVKK